MPPRSARRPSALLLASLLSLAACGDDAVSDPPLDSSIEHYEDSGETFRVTYDEGWMAFDQHRSAEFESGAPRTLRLCGLNDPSSVVADDETSACVSVRFDKEVLGAGPMTLAVAGDAIAAPTDSFRDITFTPRKGHSPKLQAVFVATGCYGTVPKEALTQEVAGQLVLEENSDTRVRGRLVLRSVGKTAGRCSGDGAEVALSFDVAR
ncbi:hypothetical protein HUA74_44180 [Myxococcus sp. CA051A]|nr:hypothetical protein [Myxococcus sp. CA051A]NTX67668.1 hypothetical protein [Myxococcus sp. CA051A]